ncbi:MAG TPA: sulfite exporter TauE/SafE family protein [Marmoricola sp.]
MTLLEAIAVLLAGVAAGTINTVVGSGTLITFPTLLAVGLPPVTANVSNTIGLVPGSLSGTWGYRRELRGQGHRLRWLMPATTVGGVTGAVLLLWLPESAFEAVVPVLIGLGVVLVVLGPRISRAVVARHHAAGGLRERGAWWVWPSVLGTGVYGGYFGAAQGVLLMAIFGIGIDDDPQRHNAIKNVLAALVNAVAAVVFVVVADVDWWAVLVLATGAVVGGVIGASVGRRLPAPWLRAVIVAVGVAAIVSFLV